MESMEIMPTRVRVASILKKALFSGEYKSGDELSLTEIAGKLGISRTPVREAFQQLESEGLIELRMNKGAIVKPIDEKYIRDHYEMRILLESEAAFRAAKNGMPDVDSLLLRLNSIRPAIASISNQDYESLNLDVHSSIWKAADNDRLYKFLSMLWNGPSIGYLNPKLDHYTKSTDEHIAILEAIKAQDAEKAKKMMEIHIERSMDNILDSFEFPSK